MDSGSWIEIGALVLVGALFIAVPVAITLLLLFVPADERPTRPVR